MVLKQIDLFDKELERIEKQYPEEWTNVWNEKKDNVTKLKDDLIIERLFDDLVQENNSSTDLISCLG
jgi:hypothetical protein